MFIQITRKLWKETIDEIQRITSMVRNGRTKKNPMIIRLFSLATAGANSRVIIGNYTLSYSNDGVIWKITT